MSVPVDNDVGAVGRKQLVRRRHAELVPMAHVNPDAIDVEIEGIRKPGTPRRIGVSPDRVHRCDRAKLLEDAVADIARMQNHQNALERIEDRRANQPVRIGDEAY